ncbi:hypothetical protein BD311DRAFT_766940 [Dichomitus squalens]|uniref:Uncharacterized protein n=1 Tax=Dichomitus squalens TaxID=114155 RepID=A0A4Q9MAK9_9APHY|nr:hypothetical protein BD311DRAFT_766940 [Dichomitus squalens]
MDGRRRTTTRGTLDDTVVLAHLVLRLSITTAASIVQILFRAFMTANAVSWLGGRPQPTGCLRLQYGCGGSQPY